MDKPEKVYFSVFIMLWITLNELPSDFGINNVWSKILFVLLSISSLICVLAFMLHNPKDVKG